MPRQTIIWTVLPNGISGNKARFSVLVSPRLEPIGVSGSVDQFPDFWDWPRMVLGDPSALPPRPPMLFTLMTDFGLVVSQLQPVRLNLLNSATWKAIFPRTLTLQQFATKHAQDYAQRPIRTYPSKDVHTLVTTPYRSMAVAPDPTRPPDWSTMRHQDHFGPMAMVASTQSFAAEAVNNQLISGAQPSAFSALDFAASASNDESGNWKTQWRLMAAQGFHAPSTPQLKPGEKRPALPPQPPLHFHQLISALGHHPGLMRRLGLVLDFEVLLDPSQLPLLEKAVWIVPDYVSSLPTADRLDHPARTYLDTADPHAFRPNWTVRDEFRNGTLRLGDSDLFHVSQIEIGAAALRVLDFGTSLIDSPTDPTPPHAPPDRLEDSAGPLVGAPALRSEGISVSHIGLAQKLHDVFQQASARNRILQQNPPGPTLLFAADLLRGFRVDVREIGPSGPGPWVSLCRRNGAYGFLTTGEKWLAPEEEGWVSHGTSEPMVPLVDSHGNRETRVHETIFRWGGWSLCVPRPGNPITDDRTPPSEGAPEDQNNFRVRFTVPSGSLPKLRFGRTYQLRARVVDLAGNSLSVGDPEESGATEPIRYGRYEPVSSPHIVPPVPHSQLENSPGESVDRLVIRSQFSPGGALLPITPSTERHILPPRTSEQLAEWHGRFDLPAGGMDPSAYDLINQHSGDLPEFFQDPPVTLPYLPDPMASGVSFAGLPGDGGVVRQISLWDGPTWPAARSLRIRLTGGLSLPQWDAVQRVLTVSLPPAGTAAVDLSSYLSDADLDLMGIWHWIEEQNPGHLEQLRGFALQGCHWMLTPCRRMNLVHAVQQPMLAPSFLQLTAQRARGNTFAVLMDSPMPIDGKSTIHVDVEAQWQEWVDDPRYDSTNPDSSVLYYWGPRPVAGHAFRTDALSSDQTAIPLSSATNAQLLPAPPPPAPPPLPVNRHEFGDTKRRIVQYQAVATTRFRDYFAAASAGAPDPPGMFTRSSGWHTVDIPSSAPPLPPDILYVVPTFEWQQVNTTTRVRRGNGVRVYMKRGWFSSGEGELLGVVLPQPPDPRFANLLPMPHGRFAFSGLEDTPLYAQHVTEWAVDSIWGVGPGTGPMWTDLNRVFPQASISDQGLLLREGDPTEPQITDPSKIDPQLRSMQVSVAGHGVQLDRDRGLLYSDIEIDPGDYYMPFVRLALARYQPNSLRFGAGDPANPAPGTTVDLRLSKVVRADFVQLTADRMATVVTAPDLRSVTVTVSGTGQADDISERADKARMELVLQARIAGLPDDDLGWRAFTDAEYKDHTAPLKLEQIGPDIHWIGTLQLPAPSNQFGALRVAIREYETLYPGAPLDPFYQTERLVYADTVALSVRGTGPGVAPFPMALELDKSVDRATAKPGEILTYTITATNKGRALITNATITDMLSPNVELMLPQSPLAWRLDRLHVGIPSAPIQFQVRILKGTPQGTEIRNQACINLSGPQYIQCSNTVITVVSPPFVGTWYTPGPGRLAASLTVDHRGGFTFWAMDASNHGHVQANIGGGGQFDGQSDDTVMTVNGSLDAPTGPSVDVLFERGRIPLGTYDAVPLESAPDYSSPPSALWGTWHGAATILGSDRLDVSLSIDPGGNGTIAADLNAGGRFSALYNRVLVAPSGQLLDAISGREIGTLSPVNNNELQLTYHGPSRDYPLTLQQRFP